MRNLLRRYLPETRHFREHRMLRILGHRLHDPDIWHLNRRSAAGGLSIGLFMAFMPVPFQMILAAPAAILARVNLPIAVVSVWISNPLTMPPMFVTCYKLGAWILSVPARHSHFEFSLRWFTETAVEIWQPLLLGCLLLGAIAALLGNIAVRLSWRLHLLRRWRVRAARRRRALAAPDH